MPLYDLCVVTEKWTAAPEKGLQQSISYFFSSLIAARKWTDRTAREVAIFSF